MADRGHFYEMQEEKAEAARSKALTNAEMVKRHSQICPILQDSQPCKDNLGDIPYAQEHEHEYESHRRQCAFER